jgi:tRNA A-37 threonylcarbamoyl transferase component Bud32
METGSPQEPDANHTQTSNPRARNKSRKTVPLDFDPGQQKTTTKYPAPVVDVIDPKLARQYKLIAVTSQIVVLILAILGVIGWAFGIEWLRHPGDRVALQGPAAVNFLLLSIALLLLSTGMQSTPRTIVGRLLAIVVASAGTAAFLEHTGHLDWDNLVLWKSGEGFGLQYPGPLLPHESFCFILLGLGTLLHKVTLKNQIWPSQILALLVFIPAFIVMICYLLGHTQVCFYFGCAQLSPISTIVFLIYTLGLFFASPEASAARVFSLTSTAGSLARRTGIGILIVVVSLLPCYWLVASGFVDAPTADIGSVVFACLALGAFGWWCFRRIESEQVEKEQVIQRTTEAIENMQVAEEKRLKLVCLTCMAQFPDSEMTHCPNDQTELVHLPDDITPGFVFGDRYQVLEELGSGGMSTVYLAEHIYMRNKVAIKVLRTQSASDPKIIQRFQREAQSSSSLAHKNLVAIHDFNVTKDGKAYMVMEFLEGLSLDEFIDRGKPMPWREAVLLFQEICDGMQHAHSKGVVHRDLKPGNIMLLPSPDPNRRFTPKIVDFGLAKVIDSAGLHLTQTGEVFGSPLYMSPEQCQGKSTDARTDIYALGCIMFATLAGLPPFIGASLMETLMMHLSAPIPPLPGSVEVPSWLQEIVRKALAKQPDERFQSVTDLMESLSEHSTEPVGDLTGE